MIMGFLSRRAIQVRLSLAVLLARLFMYMWNDECSLEDDGAYSSRWIDKEEREEEGWRPFMESQLVELSR